MDNVDTDNLLVSKENIQPLRHGRDTSKLCAALQAETDSELQQILEKQRNEFEIRLRSRNSDDPLSDWCDYVHWIEQSFPKQPREGKLNVVLRKCLNKFKDNEKYKNDLRFVKLCIKYAEIEDSTFELLSQIHHHGIGVTCAELYIVWAEKYALSNCFKKANIIYEKGIRNKAEPLALLKEAHQNFHAFLVRRMLSGQEEFKPTFSEHATDNFRQPYNVLRPVPAGQTEVVSNVRVGPNVKGSPGKLKMGATQERKPKSNKCIKIFEDTENENATVEPTAKLEKIPNKKTLSKENTVKPGPWTDKKNKKVPFNVEFSNNPFPVHRDEGEHLESNRVQNVPSSVLKSHNRKDFEEDSFANIPLFYPEPEDKTKIAMYCKDQVYAGGLEFQFEELRAIEYNKKRAERNMKSSKPTNIVQESNLESSKQIEVDCNAPASVCSTSSPSDPNKNFINELIKPESKILKCWEDSDSGESEKSKTKRKTIFSKTKPADQIAASKCLTEEMIPPTDHSMNQTIHTKEALSEMQQLWFSKPASPLLQDNVLNKKAGKSILKPARPCFNLYIDESCIDNFKDVEVPEKPLDLTIKTNITPEILLPTLANADIDGEALDFGASSNIEHGHEGDALARRTTRFDDENKENDIPPGYCGEFGKSTRKVTGILTPAENIPVAPLSDGEDDEAYEEEDDLIYGAAAQCNTTGITENLTKAFQFPINESTPNPRKSCQFRQNVNRSLFDFEGHENREDHENKNDVYEKVIFEEPVKVEEKFKGIANPVSSKRSPSNKEENQIKNLSVIVETSREYKSSSSGSSGVSTLQSRSFKNYPVTPLDRNGYMCGSVASTSGLNKTKKFNLTGYEASTESTQTGLRSGLISSGKLGFAKGTSDLNDYSCESSLLKAKETVPVVEDLVKSGITSVGNDEENIRLDDIDPFSDSLIEQLLKLARFPSPRYANGFINVDTSLPLPKVGSSITLGYYNYDVRKIVGEGSYARVFDLTNKATGSRIIAKIQKPPCRWEFYIVKEIHLRINDKIKAESFMKIESAYFFQNSSVLLTIPVEFGSLLDAINVLKQNQQLCQLTAVYFTVDILRILDTLHSCKIIHADIKPDNFLVQNRDGKPRLQLIDFGRSIDMTLFPEGTKFNKVITTDGFLTTEMRTGKPWTYQVDLYGAANCSHCLLYGDYMTVGKKNGLWNIEKLIPRYWAREEWKNYFTTLLNIESCDDIPKISSLISPFEAMLTDNKELDLLVYRLNNLLKSR